MRVSLGTITVINPIFSFEKIDFIELIITDNKKIFKHAFHFIKYFSHAT